MTESIDHRHIQQAPEIEPPREYTLEGLLDMDFQELETLDSSRLANTPAYVLASFLERLRVDDRRIILRKVNETQASEILAEMDAEDTAETMGAMREWRAVKILDELDLDDATDVVGELEEEDRTRLLSKMLPQTAATVRDLLTYPEDTAGGIMNPEVTTVTLDASVDQAIQQIRKLRDYTEHLHYIYVVDEAKHLKGVLSLRDLLLARPNDAIESITKTALKGVCNALDDKEKVALTLSDLNFSALPIVDDENKLLGIVTYDDVIDIIQEEATEDIQKLVGAGPHESIHDNLSYSITRRGPWLLVNLLTAFMAASVVYYFRNQIEALTLLAVFMPIIASLGGNTGSQTLAVAIRSLALGEIQDSESARVCIMECMKGLANGILIGFVASIIVWIGTRHTGFSLVVFIACILNMGIAGLAGAFIPIFLKRMSFDPAQSSSIFLTTVTDITGFFVFLSLGTWLLL